MDWAAMIGLGAYHGINPGMGWLFAVALGMQARRASAMWRALPPLALGHVLAVGVVVALFVAGGVVLPLNMVKAIIAVMLVTLGLYRVWRHRHPRFGGMQVGFRDLTIWSFLMASAHGAGLMVVPFVIGNGDAVAALAASPPDHAHTATADTAWTDAMAVGLHTLSYVLVSTLIAWVVYRKLGVAFLRVAWFNLDWIWAAALVVTGAFVFLS
jgi:hypothetical protein